MIIFKDAQKILDETKLVDNFLELARMDTQSDEKSKTSPSTEKQLPALNFVKEKLLALGLSDAAVDENGYLFATYPGNIEGAKAIGLIAHIDTAPDFSGTNVKPVLHENYQGGKLNEKTDWVISPEDTPQLNECIGDTIITADGATLLGSDDKSGVAEIIAAIEMLKSNPDVKHPPVRVGITPDEEIGRGASKFDIEKFNAVCAFTMDGGFAGEINGETFSADGAKVKFTGVAVHPGFAKNRLVNALRYASKFVDMLPTEESPENTEKREGFYHPVGFEGNSAEAVVQLILRDFDTAELKKRSEFINGMADTLRAEEPRLKIDVDISKSYRNMAEGLKNKPEIMEILHKSVEMSGLKPSVVAIRGGTDGSGLTAKGLPTPNIFAGGMNFHGPREWVSTRVMGLSVCTILNLLQLWGDEK